MHKKSLTKEGGGDKSHRIPKKRSSSKNQRQRLSSTAVIDEILQGREPNIDPMDLRLPNEESTKYFGQGK